MKRLLRTLILWVVRVLGWPGTRHAQRRPRSPHPRILLVRPDHLGDLLLVTPVLRALQEYAPDAHIALLVGPWSRAIVERHPAVARVLTCPFPGFQRASQSALAPYLLLFKMARQLRRERYDLAINLRPDFWWGAALLYLARIPCRVGYALQPGQPFLNVTLPAPAHEHAAVSNLRLVSAALLDLGFKPLAEPFTPQNYPLHFVPNDEERAWARERLSNEDIDEETPLIVIPPGSGGAVKLWRVQAWAHCANTLQAALTSPLPPRTGGCLAHPPDAAGSPVLHTGREEASSNPALQAALTSRRHARIMLTGSPGERALVEEIARDIVPAASVVTDASIGQLATLLERATCVLTVDNGPGHLAVAQNTLSIHLFGPTDPRIFGPWGDPTRHIVLASSQRCPTCPTIPCGRLDWSQEELAEHPCVRVIKEEQVLQATRELLQLKETQERA